MDKTSWWAVMGRALAYGTCMGASTGGPVFGSLIALTAVILGPRMFVFALAVTVIGGTLGGVVGLLGAILPGAAVASFRGRLHGRMRLARLGLAALSGLEVDAAIAIGQGGPGAATATSGGIEFLVSAFALFAAVGAYGLDYAIAGRKCAPARRVARCLRRICPCRRFRLQALATA